MGIRGTRLKGSVENCILSSLTIYTDYSKFWGDKIRKNEMGAECSTYTKTMASAECGWGNLREKNHLGGSS